MGVDLGERRIGVAISDALEITAQPYCVIERGPELLEKLAAIAREFDVVEVVVGLPLRMGGIEGSAARDARAESREIGDCLGIPVILWDERLSTAAAERVLVDQRVRRRKRREVIDKVAAAIFLQGYLDHRKGRQ